MKGFYTLGQAGEILTSVINCGMQNQTVIS